MSGRWLFYRGGPSAPRYGGDPTKHAVDQDVETFVREVLQNANDQARDDLLAPVEVRFRFLSLSGEELESFREAIEWDQLHDHLHAVAEMDRGLGHRQFLDRLDEDEELRLLVVEDRNTTGLVGEWDDAGSNYTALVRDELYSNKQDDTAGGTYGLGKSVLWTFSGASTVLFDSVLHADDPRTNRRLIARSKLPTHDLAGDEYQGAGWFCTVEPTEDGDRPASLWGADASSVAERAGIARGPDVTGTSAVVVGFRDPTTEGRRDLDSLAETFVDATVENFWPAIYRGDLAVTVETPEETYDVDVRDSRRVRPFVEAYAGRSDADETLESPGDVAVRSIPITLPDRRDGEPARDGEAALCVRLAGPTDDDGHLNHVAMFRGAGMVVDYDDQSRVASRDRNFHAVLAAGRARKESDPTIADNHVDRFLRFAEPPTHDEWTSTEKLKEEYKRGYRKAIVDAMDEVREALRDLVARDVGGDGSLPESVRRKFLIHGEGDPRSLSTPSRSRFDVGGSASFGGDRWEFHGHVEPTFDDAERWSATVSLTGVGEDGRKADGVAVETLVVDHDDVDVTLDDGVARLSGQSNSGRVSFDGRSIELDRADVRSGRVGETRLTVETTVESGGGD